jgi:hypothetical protein
MDTPVSSAQTRAKVQEWWPDLKVEKTTIRSNLGFKFQSPMLKQDLSPEHRFQIYQFGLDAMAKNLDRRTIVFSDECRFVLGSDKRWRPIQ